MKVGYIRVSAKDQNPARQIETMRKLNIEERFIFIDKASGKNMDRESYQAMKLVLRKGDVLYLDALSRLGRDYDSIISEWKDITRSIGCDIIVLDNEMFNSQKFREMGDLGKLLEDLFLSTLAYVADHQRKEIKRAQAEGIALAKAAGKYKGRKPITIDPEAFEEIYLEVLSKDRTNKSAMKKLGLKPNTYYRFVKEYSEGVGCFELLKKKSN